MVAVLYISAVRILEAVHFFEAINVGAFASFVTEEHFCTWYVGARDGFKGVWSEKNYEAKFIPNYGLT